MTPRPGSFRAAIRRPIFIVSPPRSGSTLLFQTLAQSPSLCSIGNESHGLIEGIPAFHPASHGWHSNRMTADHFDERAVEEMSRRFAFTLRDRDGSPARRDLRMLEKTPKNSLRVPLLRAAYPDAQFLFLYREARPTLASMMEAWKSGRFRTYPRLPNWPGLPWSLLLFPGWEELRGAPLAQIVAHQWANTIDILVSDLKALPREDVHAISYEHFTADPQAAMQATCERFGLEWDRELGEELPLSRYTVSSPDPDKWRRHEAEIESVWHLVAGADAKARQFAERFSAHAP